jgi:hypothetical protein
MKIQHIRGYADNPRELLGQKSSGGKTLKQNAKFGVATIIATRRLVVFAKEGGRSWPPVCLREAIRADI